MSPLIHFFAFSLLAVGCAQNSPREYPETWWAPVETKEAPKWEVFPHQAKPGEVILSKRNELGILSNFAPTPFELDGKKYASVEGFWQMMKYPESPGDERAKWGEKWPHTREQVSQMVAFEAKKAGDVASDIMKKHNANWVTYNGKKLIYKEHQKGEHYQTVRRAMLAKLKANPEVKRVLLQTRGLKLKPDHHQGDNPAPAWRYYEIWEDIRDSELSSF